MIKIVSIIGLTLIANACTPADKAPKAPTADPVITELVDGGSTDPNPLVVTPPVVVTPP